VHAIAATPASAARPARRRAALTLVAAVLAAHVLLLARAPARPGDPGRAPRPLQVRQIVTPGPAAAGVDATAPPTAAAGPIRPTPRAARPPPHAAAATTPTQPAPAGAPPPMTAGVVGAATYEVRADIIEKALPVYAARLPPAATMHYAVGSGAGAGQATLRWQVADGRYRLTLERALAGQPAQGSASQGDAGAGGVAPERYTESRRGRDQRAVNFQRDAGLITFSAPSAAQALSPGAQDRLSWMLQLPAVLEAEPALREPGSEVLMVVAGTRGDAEVWAFTVQGREAVDTPAGPVADALHLQRLPRRPYDTQIDAWLDPARHHLPVRLRLQLPPAGGSTEFALERHDTP